LTLWLAITLVAALWMGSSFAIALGSGWARLARRFPNQSLRATERVRRLTLMVGSYRYRRMIDLTLADDKWRLMMPLSYRVGHRPIVIPWNAVRSCDQIEHQGEGWMIRSIVVRLRGVEDLELTFFGRAGDMLWAAWQRRRAARQQS
jgi:hypothetical protein